MASHHHHHCNNNHCCCTTTTNNPSHTISQPPPLSIDPLLQALASQILLQQKKKQHSNFQQHEDHQNNNIVSSLLSRIEALESSLHRISSNATSSSYHRLKHSSIRDVAARTIQTHFRAFLVRRSRTLRNLKDLAIIKSAFNALESSISRRMSIDSVGVYRKAMNLLRELDSIQGGDPMIRDGKRSISRDLIRFLDFIDRFSADRSTKATMNVKYVQHNNKHMAVEKNCRGFGGRDQMETMDKLWDRIRNMEGYARESENYDDGVELEGFHQGSEDDEFVRASNYGNNGVSQIRKHGQMSKKIGVQSSLKKCVSFVDDGNIARVFVGNSGDPRFDNNPRERMERFGRDDVEEIGSFSKEAEADEDEEIQIESGGSDQTSDGEGTPKISLGAEGDHEISEHYHAKNGNLIFSAPEPVKMESRAEVALHERLRKMEERLISKKS